VPDPDPFSGHRGEVQAVRALFEGLPLRRDHLGEEATGSHQSGKMHEVQIVHKGVQILGD
jgi:hypothetical protein